MIQFLTATGLTAKRTSVRAPWQNGTAERWVGSGRREILDHIIALNEQHLRRLIRDYVNYYHDDRVHDSLGKDTPNRRPAEQKPTPQAAAISNPRLGGLHHRYSWRKGRIEARGNEVPLLVAVVEIPNDAHWAGGSRRKKPPTTLGPEICPDRSQPSRQDLRSPSVHGADGPVSTAAQTVA